MREKGEKTAIWGGFGVKNYRNSHVHNGAAVESVIELS